MVVTYDAKRCIHAEECVHGLPQVFDPNRRPWIDAGQASPQEIAEVVMRCPTGALYYKHREMSEPVPKSNRVAIAPDGPLYLHGDVELTLADGSVVKETRVALCRCGDSQNKPFCDNTHLESGFSDAGQLQEAQPESADPCEEAPLKVSAAPDGPLIVQGPVQLQGSQSQEPLSLSGGALCRYGASKNKPFCDGSHAQTGFQAD